jgi:SpoVK/Ycf46/Vps4 family AAA+-type ATPase
MHIIKSAGTYSFYNEIEINKTLSPGVYTIEWDGYFNCYLKDGEPLTVPEKLYDVEKPFREQVVNSFRKIPRNLGVLLSGYKGQGKSVTAKLLCKELNIPVLMITRQVPKEVNLLNQLNVLKQEYILFIDEFEKIFKKSSNSNDGEKKYHTDDVFLSIMDGGLSSTYKKLFLLTTNSEIGDYFINRPSRIRYYKNYQFIPESLYTMIVNDKLENKEFENDLREHLSLNDCTIDLLCSIIEEINIHNVPYSSFKEFFNHKPKKITYRRDEWINDEWKYKDDVDVDMEINRNTTHIQGRDISKIQFNGDEIIYRSKWMKYDEDDEPEPHEALYRLTKSNFNSDIIKKVF